MVALIYELLDAHDDTVRIVTDEIDDPLLEAHLDYLRDLQRKGREVLAGRDRSRAKRSVLLEWTLR